MLEAPNSILLEEPPISSSPPARKNMSEKENMTRRSQFLQNIMTQFWKQWRKQYLTELQEYCPVDKRAKSRRGILQGDIVSIHEDKVQWGMGRVMQLLTGRDGNVRSARVRVMSEGGRGQEITKPIERLYPLEVTAEEDQSDGQNNAVIPIRMVSDADIPVVVVADH